ncbi:hypothetical protein B0H19DRAFT_1106021 [Mycena capillaripes]|nr:hypothetical protein B0H19DRAFT_1106021 [Mycena capillaripes]
MANHLPDEIVSEILSPALKVGDEVFSDTSLSSPFAVYSESSSAFLLVCKAWLRVATPLLYHVVVLRSKAQAAALDIALRGNPLLGRFIKKLRVEGGYGSAMLKIIKAAPNVTDLFISVNIWSADNVSGLIRGLPLMDPNRVVLYDTPYHGARNKNSQILLETLCKCLKEWENLTIFELPYSNNYYYSTTTLISIASSLSEAPALKTVVAPATRIFHQQQPPEHLMTIAKNPSLQSIQLKQSKDSRFTVEAFATSVAYSHPSLRGLIKFPEQPDLPDFLRTPSPKPFVSKTLQYSTVSVPEEIWDRILYFAMTLNVESPDWISKSRQPRLGLVLVSKLFSRLALPYLKETLIFRSSHAFDALGVRLKDDESLGPQIRTLYFDTPPSANITLRPILKTKLVNIIAINPFTVTQKTFSDLVNGCGSTLVRLEGLQVAKSTGKAADPALFSSFTNIRSLSLGLKASFATSTSIPRGALATLEQLTLTNFDQPLMTALCEMDLPALRHAAFPGEGVGLGEFLSKHGRKLQTLTVSIGINRPGLGLLSFDNCPAIVDFTVVCGQNIPNAAHYSCFAARPSSLETITFKTDGRIRGADRKWAKFFDALNITTFPALRQISLPCIRWPTNEHDIAKSLWVKWADRLLDSDVKLIDAQGVGWRRRLKK